MCLESMESVAAGHRLTFQLNGGLGGEPIALCWTIPSMERSDSDEWAGALSGDGEAFGRVFDRHHARLVRHSQRIVPTAADVEDVVAIVFFEAWRKRHDVRFVEGSLLPWLLVTATNAARNINRSARRYRALLDRLPRGALAANFYSCHDDEAETALRHLSQRDQQVIVLCVLEQFSEAEAACAIGIPRGTVKSRLSRAKARLAAELENHPRSTASISERA